MTEPIFDEKQYLRNIYYKIEKERQAIKNNGFDVKSLKLLVELKLVEIQSDLVNFAKKKGWVGETEQKLCELKKVSEQGKCENCH